MEAVHLVFREAFKIIPSDKNIRLIPIGLKNQCNPLFRKTC